MRKLSITILIGTLALCICGCGTTENVKEEHHDSFIGIEVDRGNNTNNETGTEIDEDNTVDNVEETVEFVEQDLSFAREYADIVKNAAEIVILSSDEETYDTLGIRGVIGNSKVEDIMNQATLNNGYERYELVYNTDTVYIVSLDFDYWVIFYEAEINDATGYRDATGTLATMYGEMEEDIEYEDWD